MGFVFAYLSIDAREGHLGSGLPHYNTFGERYHLIPKVTEHTYVRINASDD
jgi:hypothetical protein